MILDVMMPGTDGFSACSVLRREAPDLPILIVSAKDSPYDRVTGLNLGSDDYLVKPFLPLELVARIRAILRRSHGSRPAREEKGQRLVFGGLSVTPGLRIAELDGAEFPLTPTEFDFLVYLLENRERAVSREELLKVLWQVEWQTDPRAVDDLVKRLRRKLRQRQGSIRIETVWGYGFRLSSAEE